MAYIEPLVMVFQEYAALSSSTATAALPPCIIGPCFHIIDPIEDETLALAGTYTLEGIQDAFFPNNAPGAQIQADSVVLRFKNMKLKLNDAPLAASSANLNVLTFTASTFPEYLEIGDTVTLGASGAELFVVDVDDTAHTVMLNKTAGSASGINVYRTAEELIIPGTATGVTLDCSGEKFTVVGIEYGEYKIAEAELYVGYRALRQDKSSVGVVYSVDDITAQCGKIVPENPLAYGLNVTLANTTTGVYYVGVDSEDLAGYTAAKDRIENYSPLYAIVPLTQDAGILSMFKNHAEQMSTPEEGNWRIALGNSPLVTSSVPGSGRGVLSEDGDGDLVVLTDDDAKFMASGVDAGDTVTLTDGNGTKHDFTVAGVASDDILTVVQSAPFSTPFVSGSSYVYEITHAMNLDEQARAVGAASKAYGSRRFVHVWPDICVIDGRELPGYYLCCAVAGAVAGLPSQYGLTRLSVSGITAVKHAGDYFNREQLNMIADGGTFIFVQAAPSAPPHIRHQLTTDRSALEFQELSFVKNFDYVCYICKDVLDVYLGKWNITDETYGAIRTALTGTLENLRLAAQPKIGAPVLSYSVGSIARLENTRDRIEAQVTVEFPYPLNTIGLHIVSA